MTAVLYVLESSKSVKKSVQEIAPELPAVGDAVKIKSHRYNVVRKEFKYPERGDNVVFVYLRA